MSNSQIPVLGFVACSGTGKTTLLKQLIPLLRERGLCIGLIKHTHHDFDLDIPGKDSYELRKAGAAQVLVASHRRWALITEPDQIQEPRLQTMLEHLDQVSLDLILVEGFTNEQFPKIELYRSALGRPVRYSEDPDVIAVATDKDLPVATELPQLDINDIAAISEFVLGWTEKRRSHNDG